MDAGALVRQARQGAGLSQRLLAERAGVRRQTVSQVESGIRTPSLGMLVGLLAAAGAQMRVELEPLDEDVRRSIAERRARPDASSDVVAVWAAVPALRGVAHRVEGMAAASLLGAPVAVPIVHVALADTAATSDWLAAHVRARELRVWPDGWLSPLSFGRCDDQAGAALRALLSTECPDDRFRLEGWFDEIIVRFAPADVVARCVHVRTADGTIPVQPLDEVETTDATTARVLRLMREDR